MSQNETPQTMASLNVPLTAGVDRRTARTRKALREALAWEIKHTGDIKLVTATAVADQAGVTRRTFYSHYKDMPDFVSSVEDECLTNMRPYLEHLAGVNLEDLEEAISCCEPCPGSKELLSYIKSDERILSALLGQSGDAAFVGKIQKLTHDILINRVSEGIKDSLARPFIEYYLTYAIAAEVGVLVRWLTTGTQESVDIIARVMTGLTFVRPGDLYGKNIDFDIGTFGLTLFGLKEEADA